MAYFVTISDKDKIPRFVFWLKKTDRAYVTLKELVEASQLKLTAPSVKSLSYEAFLKVAAQSMLTINVSNPNLETPKVLQELAHVVMHLVEHNAIDEKLVGDDLKRRYNVLLNEQAALEASGKRITNARYGNGYNYSFGAYSIPKSIIFSVNQN